MRSLLLVLLAFGLFMAAKYFYSKPKFIIGAEAPVFETLLENGEEFDLNSTKGEFILLDFWGSWCGPCRAENPKLVKLYDEFHGRNYEDASNFDIVSVAIETEKRAWQKAVEQDGLDWARHIVQTDRFSSEIAVLYGVREIPTSYLLNQNGIIVGVNMTYDEMKTYLNKQLARRN